MVRWSPCALMVVALLNAPLAMGVVSKRPSTSSPQRATDETPEAASKGESLSCPVPLWQRRHRTGE